MKMWLWTYQTYQFLEKKKNTFVLERRGFEGVFMDGHSSVDVTQSEGDFNQSEH